MHCRRRRTAHVPRDDARRRGPGGGRHEDGLPGHQRRAERLGRDDREVMAAARSLDYQPDLHAATCGGPTAARARSACWSERREPVLRAPSTAPSRTLPRTRYLRVRLQPRRRSRREQERVRVPAAPGRRAHPDHRSRARLPAPELRRGTPSSSSTASPRHRGRLVVTTTPTAPPWRPAPDRGGTAGSPTSATVPTSRPPRSATRLPRRTGRGASHRDCPSSTACMTRSPRARRPRALAAPTRPLRSSRQNLVTIGAYGPARARPHHIALVGFDDIPLGDLLDPASPSSRRTRRRSGASRPSGLRPARRRPLSPRGTIVPTRLIERGSGEIPPREEG